MSRYRVAWVTPDDEERDVTVQAENERLAREQALSTADVLPANMDDIIAIEQ